MEAAQNFLKNQYVNAALTVFLISYACLARPQLPSFLARLFESSLFRLVFLFLLAWIASRDAQVALLVAVAFVITMNVLSEQRMVEGFIAGMHSNN